MSSFVSACCNTPPVRANYTPTGNTFQVNGTKIYLTGRSESRFGVIFCYDIFGFHSNAYQYADLLGQAGFRVAMPDFLHDKPLTVADLGNKDIFADFLINRAGWTVNRDDFIKTLKLLSDEGMQQIGALGFCWGAKLVVGAIGEDLGISAGCLIHPSALVPEDFEQVRAPILVIESRDEKDFSEEFEGVRRRFGKSVRDRYNDMHHGFAGARGDWSDEVQADRVNQAIRETISFLGMCGAARK